MEEGLLDPHRMIQIGVRGAISDASNFDFARAAGVQVIVFIEEPAERGILRQCMSEARALMLGDQLYLCVARHRRARSVDRLWHRHSGDRRNRQAGKRRTMIRLLDGARSLRGPTLSMCRRPSTRLESPAAAGGRTLMFELLCAGWLDAQAGEQAG